MKKLEDYVNFKLYDLTNYNYIAADNDGEVWAFTEFPEFYEEDSIYDVHNSSYGTDSIGLGKLLTEQQVRELKDRVIQIDKVYKLSKLNNLYSLANGEKTTLYTILNTIPSYYSEYILNVLQGLDSTITTLSLELKDERVARSKLSKELKLIAQELE